MLSWNGLRNKSPVGGSEGPGEAEIMRDVSQGIMDGMKGYGGRRGRSSALRSSSARIKYKGGTRRTLLMFSRLQARSVFVIVHYFHLEP
jgi:hypothetical protein